MYLERKQDLSIYYWLKDLFAPYPMVTINDGYPQEDLQLPSVVVEGGKLDLLPLELGSRKGLRERNWVIDITANNKAQRDEFTSFILDNLEDGIAIYDYDEGFPPDVSPTQIGTLQPFDIDTVPIIVFPNIIEKLYWRQVIRFYTQYQAI